MILSYILYEKVYSAVALECSFSCILYVFLDKINHCDVAVTATNWDMYDTYQLTKELEEAANPEKTGEWPIVLQLSESASHVTETGLTTKNLIIKSIFSWLSRCVAAIFIVSQFCYRSATIFHTYDMPVTLDRG